MQYLTKDSYGNVYPFETEQVKVVDASQPLLAEQYTNVDPRLLAIIDSIPNDSPYKELFKQEILGFSNENLSIPTAAAEVFDFTGYQNSPYLNSPSAYSSIQNAGMNTSNFGNIGVDSLGNPLSILPTTPSLTNQMNDYVPSQLQDELADAITDLGPSSLMGDIKCTDNCEEFLKLLDKLAVSPFSLEFYKPLVEIYDKIEKALTEKLLEELKKRMLAVKMKWAVNSDYNRCLQKQKAIRDLKHTGTLTPEKRAEVDKQFEAGKYQNSKKDDVPQLNFAFKALMTEHDKADLELRKIMQYFTDGLTNAAKSAFKVVDVAITELSVNTTAMLEIIEERKLCKLLQELQKYQGALNYPNSARNLMPAVSAKIKKASKIEDEMDQSKKCALKSDGIKKDDCGIEYPANPVIDPPPTYPGTVNFSGPPGQGGRLPDKNQYQPQQ